MGPVMLEGLADRRFGAQVRNRAFFADAVRVTQRRRAIARSAWAPFKAWSATGSCARAIGQVQVRVREGKGMARPLSESGLFPMLALNMIAVGEESGKLDGMLSEVASFYDQEVRRSTKRLTSLLEPALILGMGLIIAVVVISMLMAIFQHQ